jgi:hypothetical protein
MSENHHVKFCTGRDPNESEARSSAGTPEYYKNATQYFKPRWNVDSLHRKMRYITRGLRTSDKNWQLEEFLSEATQVLAPMSARYNNSEVIRRDADKLCAVLEERHLRLLQGTSRDSHHFLKSVSRCLEQAASRYVQQNPAKPKPHEPFGAISSTPGTEARPRTPTFGR